MRKYARSQDHDAQTKHYTSFRFSLPFFLIFAAGPCAGLYSFFGSVFAIACGPLLKKKLYFHGKRDRGRKGHMIKNVYLFFQFNDIR